SSRIRQRAGICLEEISIGAGDSLRNVPPGAIGRHCWRFQPAQRQRTLFIVGSHILVDSVTHGEQLETVDVVSLQRFVANYEGHDAILRGNGAKPMSIALLEQWCDAVRKRIGFE